MLPGKRKVAVQLAAQSCIFDQLLQLVIFVEFEVNVVVKLEVPIGSLRKHWYVCINLFAIFFCFTNIGDGHF